MDFGAIISEFSTFEDATFSVLPVPYDLTSTYQSGSRRGPSAILEASANMELYDEELGKETFLCGIHTCAPLEPLAAGPAEMVRAVYDRVKDLVFARKIPVVLGGEHTVSVGAVQAVQEKYAKLSVLHLDAHADMRDMYQGTRFSHACVGRRLAEMASVVQVGVRSMSVEEAGFLKESGIEIFSPDRISRDAAWQKKVCEKLSDDVYISVDLDVFDPSIMPSTGTPEPGGLGWRDVLTVVREVARERRVLGFDVVELAPIAGLVAPDFLAAKLVYRIMGYLTERNK